MMFWHKAIGDRGSTEIASCLLRYVEEDYTPLREGEERKLVVWSDRCAGQNNNWTMDVNTVSLIDYIKLFHTSRAKVPYKWQQFPAL
ncbi:hypothetical protein PR048_005455 [Dryococelus australis]|uniref:Uncharacterized protein n=1 Tax=Dryococelus australis TaxID=614101 RepID=A0ABQ9I8A4_9NEOP|nr:hypothetical protein PR048_005455 [Dryococelus australis]